MGGGPAGPIEGHHTLRLIKGREPLGAPLTLAVGGLVTDFDSHLVGVVWYGIILQGQGASGAPGVPVPQAAQARADSITISRTSSIE